MADAAVLPLAPPPGLALQTTRFEVPAPPKPGCLTSFKTDPQAYLRHTEHQFRDVAYGTEDVAAKLQEKAPESAPEETASKRSPWVTIGLPKWHGASDESDDSEEEEEKEKEVVAIVDEMPSSVAELAAEPPLPESPFLMGEPRIPLNGLPDELPVKNGLGHFQSPPLMPAPGLVRAFTTPARWLPDEDIAKLELRGHSTAYPDSPPDTAAQGWMGWEGAAAGMWNGVAMMPYMHPQSMLPLNHIDSNLPPDGNPSIKEAGQKDWLPLSATLAPTDPASKRPRLSIENGDDGVLSIIWSKDERVLRATDREAVSPPFNVPIGDKEVQFKLILRPKKVSENHGGESFKRAKGKGSVLLRCVDDLDGCDADTSTLHFQLWVGSREKVRGAVRRDFSQHTVHGLREEDEEWDLKGACEDGFFKVCLEVLPVA